MGTYVTRKRAPLFSSDHLIIHIPPKVYGNYEKSPILHQKVKHRNYSKNIQNLKNMFRTSNWELFTDYSLGKMARL